MLADMADLKGMRNHEMFLNFKRDHALVSPSTNFLTLKVITMLSLSFFFFFFFFFPPFFFINTLYSFPWQAIQVAHRAEEIVKSSHR